MRENVEFEKSIVRLFRRLYSYLKSSSEIKYIFFVHKYLAPFYSLNTNRKEQYQRVINYDVEYKAMTIVTCEIQWLTYLLDFKVPFEKPSLL